MYTEKEDIIQCLQNIVNSRSRIFLVRTTYWNKIYVSENFEQILKILEIKKSENIDKQLEKNYVLVKTYFCFIKYVSFVHTGMRMWFAAKSMSRR